MVAVDLGNVIETVVKLLSPKYSYVSSHEMNIHFSMLFPSSKQKNFLHTLYNNPIGYMKLQHTSKTW